MKPVSLRPCRNEAAKRAKASGEPAFRKPITGIACCCALAASGHAAAVPRSVMKSRRLIPPPERLKKEHGTGPNYALEGGDPANVRFGSKADMCSAIAHVRFTPNSDIDCVFRYVRFGPQADMLREFTPCSLSGPPDDPTT